MALMVKKGFLCTKWFPRIEISRYRRVNVQRPRAPHYERAVYLELIKPIYKKDESVYLPPSAKCRRNEELLKYKVKVENPLEKIIAKEIFEKFESSNIVGFLHKNPIAAEEEFQAKVHLKRIGYTLDVASKSTMEIALCGTVYEAVLSLFQVQTAMVFSPDNKVKPLLKVLKKFPQFILMAAIVEGQLLNMNQVAAYAEIPDLTAARLQLVSVLNNAPQQLIGRLNAPALHLCQQLNMIKSEEDTDSSK